MDKFYLNHDNVVAVAVADDDDDDGHGHGATGSVGGRGDYADVTSTVVDMHRKLLYLLSHPELFAVRGGGQVAVQGRNGDRSV